MSCSSAVRVTRPPVSGTRLTQTRTFIGGRAQDRIRSFVGSKSGVLPATATVTG